MLPKMERLQAAKIEKLKATADSVRIGGKGSARRKKKVLHKSTGADEKKVNATLKKLSVSSIPGIEEVNMFKNSGEVIHFTNPKVQASLQANTFAISGQSETKSITEMPPSVWNQLGPENFGNLKRLAASMSASIKKAEPENVDDVPELDENFDEKSKAE